MAPAAEHFVEAVLDVVDSIPAGRVMTYGDIASVLGSRASRAVGQVMALSGSNVPWWRVIRASGLPPIGHEDRALEHYRREGTPIQVRSDGSYRVLLASARFDPVEPSHVADLE